MKSKSVAVAVVLVGCLFVNPRSSEGVTLEDLFGGQTITADDKIFDNWELLELQTVNGGFANPADVEVIPLEDDPLNPGLKFNIPNGMGTPFSHVGPASATMRFSFTVQTSSGQALIKDNSLVLNGFVFDAGPDATITITETITDASGNSLGDKRVFADSFDFPDPSNPEQFDSAEFERQSLIHVEKLIDIQGPGTNDGAVLTMFEQRFSQIPEPTSLVLFALGVAAVIAFGRARRC